MWKKIISLLHFLLDASDSIHFTEQILFITGLLFTVIAMSIGLLGGLISHAIFYTFAIIGLFLIYLAITPGTCKLIHKYVVSKYILSSPKWAIFARNYTFIGMSSCLALLLGLGLIRIFPFIEEKISKWSHQSLTIIFIALASLLFYFKLKAQLLYGIFETGFAFAVVWTATEKINLTENAAMTVWLALGSAVYLVVRGFNNTYDGYKKFIEAKEMKAMKLASPPPLES